ncbi:uncharacterized protein At3g49055-like [Zingiber officinale]|uniref:uncharacterized protein At3g49055-like n=1 Tax=Zingiber officinale TaxID=94328 RepID=UPI001C4B0C64|nr:uncharacterized protein At3g49055-like [Zingiber officinale]
MEEQGPDENPNLLPHGQPTTHTVLLAELVSLRNSYRDLDSRFEAAEESKSDLQEKNLRLSLALEEASEERDSLRIKLIEAEVSTREEDESIWLENLQLSHEIEIFKGKFNEMIRVRNRQDAVMCEILDSIRYARDCFSDIGGRICAEILGEIEGKSNLDDALELHLMESKSICKLGAAVGSRFVEYDDLRKKEKKELENRIVSLTEENRDISSLLRAALVEKEALEKTLNKQKDSGEQKMGAIMQIAGRGLQKVGFGFVMGVIAGESHSDQLSSASANSDSSECDEEVVSLASTVDSIMKRLRHEVTELRQALEEYRSENEHLLSLVNKQAEKIVEEEHHIKDLEEQEKMITKNVEELTAEIKEAGEETARWREACELEVEAGKAVILDLEKEVALLKEELKRTKLALDAANNKLHLKEKLAKTAMAAQAAAEATLQLADKRSAGFRERIEELTRQLEEESEHSARREKSVGRRRVRYVCWPWQAFIFSPTGGAVSQRRERRRIILPEMESILRFN